MTTVRTTTVRTLNKERSTATSNSNVQVWIYNISKTPAVTQGPRPLLTLSGDRLTTTVLRMRFPLSNVPESMQQQAISETAKAELNRVLGTKNYVDAWGARRGEHEDIIVLVRVLATHKNALMKRSGFDELWVDTPKQDMQAYGALWLAKPKTRQSLQEARGHGEGNRRPCGASAQATASPTCEDSRDTEAIENRNMSGIQDHQCPTTLRTS